MGNSNRRYDLISIVIVFAVALLLQYTQAFSLLENETLSYRQILRTHYGATRYTAPSSDIVIVYTDEAFYKDYGAYPLRRADIGKLIRRLAKMGAKVIGVDMLLDFNSAYGEDPSLAA
ncbi:MAG TPA: CHASE2 domain-containing protein, partial [Pseudomonadales bacterium]|nr:CHASE2 domain-containing protein [Pseudomonadales bacterium]